VNAKPTGRGLLLTLCAVSAWGALGCKGAVGTSAGSGGSAGVTGPAAGVAGSTGTAGTGSVVTGAAGVAATAPPASTCAAGQTGKPAYQMLRRLSESEYNNTLIDVFGADAKSWQTIQFVGDLRQAGSFASLSSALGVNQPWMSALVDATFTRAQSLVAGTPSILVAPCTATVMDATCATAMVKTYGYRLFRRPVTDAEVADYVGLYTQGTGTLKMSPSDALAGTLAALMQSPNALYIRELGTASAGTFKLSGFELASILSYGLTGTAPSKALLDSAGTSGLDTAAGIATAVQAMIASPQGQAHMNDFFLQWLAYDGAPYAAKDPLVYTFPNTVATAMVTEAKMLVEGAYQKGGSLADVLTSPTTYVNASLARFYGWSTAGLTDTTFTAQQRPAGQGLGLLAQGGLLARLGTPQSSSPTQRGLFVLRQLICKDVPAPPANIPVIPAPSGTVTTRQRYETQHAVGSCGVCHTHMDDTGFGLENFDGVGVYRTKEAGMPVDASGYVEDLDHMTFTGPEDLARKLAAAPEVAQCLAAQMTSYVLGVSVSDGLCISPAAAYAQGATPLAMSDVLTKIVEPTHLQTRVAP
jgi:Protein of unknown function (DUF1592)/Protein of unknown function (DUF1588)/Protein of unknown function (DUF1595)/Protein of unknown function (DUF1587)